MSTPMVEVTANVSFAGENFSMYEGQTKAVSPERAEEWLRIGFVREAVHRAASAVAAATAPAIETNALQVRSAGRGRPRKQSTAETEPETENE